MTSFDDRSSSSLSSIPMPGLSQFTSSEESGAKFTIPLPALPDTEAPQTGKSPVLVSMPSTQWAPLITGSLSTSTGVSRALTDDLLSDPRTTSMRTPIVIKPPRKRVAQAPLSHAAHKKRRFFVTLVGVFVLFLITSGTLFAATPMGREMGLNLNLSDLGGHLFNNPNNTSYNLTVQATATAVYHQQTDGYVPPKPMVTDSSGSLNWPVGQCTYWANLRYHTLSGHWVSWSGNASAWAQGARAAGWNVSQSPHVPSIIVMMPGVQGASSYGHVAVVEGINANGSVHTSTMNWYGNGGGGFDRVSYVDINTGSGIYFVWHS